LGAQHPTPTFLAQVADGPVDEAPSPTPLPQGGEGFIVLNRVIASAAKQPSRWPRTHPVVPLGCFGTTCLAMTRRRSTPPRVPREGGDPDPYTPLGNKDLDPRLRGERGAERVDVTPHPGFAVLPPEGEDLTFQYLPPLGEVARRAEGGLATQTKTAAEVSLSGGAIFPEGLIDYSTILATTPAPTVRPPSRIAKRSFSSMAIGVISSTSSSALSPGMIISTPSFRRMIPVTSVVRK